MDADFDRLVNEGSARPFSGWDFSSIAERWRAGTPPWDYAGLLREKMRAATSMVDLGTGGGEFLASLAPLPRKSFATEGYLPNVAVAERRLAPLGVHVLRTGPDLRIELPDRSLDLVASRHEEFSGPEVFRILRPGGRFLTQQVGVRNHGELQETFGVSPPPATNHVSSAVGLAAEVAASGLAVRTTDEATYSDEFLDVGALVFYLRAIPWEVPGFSADRYREPLWEIHQQIERTGAFRVAATDFS